MLRIISAPSSPVQSRRLLSARGGRMSSVELPDEHDKSLSSNSASPCPSPVKQYNVRILIYLKVSTKWPEVF